MQHFLGHRQMYQQNFRFSKRGYFHILCSLEWQACRQGKLCTLLVVIFYSLLVDLQREETTFRIVGLWDQGETPFGLSICGQVDLKGYDDAKVPRRNLYSQDIISQFERGVFS